MDRDGLRDVFKSQVAVNQIRRQRPRVPSERPFVQPRIPEALNVLATDTPAQARAKRQAIRRLIDAERVLGGLPTRAEIVRRLRS